MSLTPNFALPLLFAAQAQKEITHNEALVVIDALLSGCIEGVASDPGSVAPADGKAWIVGASPAGLWAGKATSIAIFSAGGWRFAPPVDGMRVYDRARGLVWIFDGSGWLSPAAMAEPFGGDVVDVEARSTLTTLLSALRAQGLIDAT